MVRAGTILTAMRELPLMDLDALFGRSALLVLAPHPDDETLGCGGLLAECQMRGRPVSVTILTDGSASHPRSQLFPRQRLAELRRSEAKAAVAALGLPAEQIDFLGWPDGQSPTSGKVFEEAASRLADSASKRGVGVICTTWLHDPHHDHRAACLLGQRIAETIGARLLCYPVWGWTVPPGAWLPATRVHGGRLDIARHLAAKRQAIACHRSQVSDLIEDDPSGFRLSPEVLALFEQPFEVFSEI
jgi:LmbE family N-acetylglucosaminyl deacetylase